MSKHLLLALAVAAAFNCCCFPGVSGFLFTPATPALFSVKSKSSCYNRRSRSSLPSEPLANDGGGGGTEEAIPTEDMLPTESMLPTELPSTAKAGNVAEKKALLMSVIVSTSMGEQESETAAQKVNAIIGELETLKQGFKEGEVDGEWVLCFTRNSKGSPSLQKALPGDRGFQNFDVGAKKFFNIVKLWGGKVQVLADVAYDVRPEEPNKLVSTIVGAGVKLGPLRIPLPLTGRVGYLEFVYQDSDIRITRGNRGGLFLHMRPGSSFPVDEGVRVA